MYLASVLYFVNLSVQIFLLSFNKEQFSVLFMVKVNNLRCSGEMKEYLVNIY